MVETDTQMADEVTHGQRRNVITVTVSCAPEALRTWMMLSRDRAEMKKTQIRLSGTSPTGSVMKIHQMRLRADQALRKRNLTDLNTCNRTIQNEIWRENRPEKMSRKLTGG